ncbi:hypothetical protein ACTXT7_002772 [Hymenolepis weldensis]
MYSIPDVAPTILSLCNGFVINTSGSANWKTVINCGALPSRKQRFKMVSALPTDVATQVIDIVDKAPKDNP